MVDGGLVDPIPAEEAYRRGARRILVVRTRPSNVVKRNSALTRPMSRLLFRTPALSRASLDTARRYQQAVAWLKSPPADATVLELVPHLPLQTKRMTQDKVRLKADYDLGVELVSRRTDRLREVFA